MPGSSADPIKTQDYTLKFAKHECELRARQMFAHLSTWHKFFRKFVRIFTISEKNYRSLYFLRTRGAIEREIKKQIYSNHRFFFHPFSLTRLIWETFMIFVLIFSTFFLPLRSSLLNSFMADYYIFKARPLSNIYVGLYIQAGLSVIWVIDMCGNFFTGYYDKQKHEVIMSPTKIWRRYIFPNFFVDFTSSLPVDFFYVQIFGMEGYAAANKVTFTFLEIYSVYSIVRMRSHTMYLFSLKDVGISNMTFEILFVLLFFFCILAWAMWFNLVIPQIVWGRELFDSKKKLLSWIIISDILEQDLLFQVFISTLNAMRSVVRVLTLWDTFFNELDYLAGSLITIFGCLCWFYFLFLFLTCVSVEHAMDAELQVGREQIGSYLKKKELPKSLKKRLKRFYQYRYQSHYFNSRDLLRKLPSSLRKEISTYTCNKMLLNLEVFHSIPKNILARYLQKMSRELYFPKDVIIQGNTFGGSMYFICSGTVVVHTVTGKEICHLKEGEFFGEIALIAQDRRRTATVTAVTITEVYRLESSVFRKITDSYPDVYMRLEKYASERYRTIILVEGKLDLTKKPAGEQ